jgi:ABC-type taurine transport system ATPase subunit
VARAVAFVPDLLFGSNVLGALQAGGHDSVLVNTLEDVDAAVSGADVLIVDLTHDAEARIGLAAPALGDGPPRTLAFFSHVEGDVRTAAQRAGFDLVVPRSRMARAASALVDELVSSH